MALVTIAYSLRIVDTAACLFGVGLGLRENGGFAAPAAAAGNWAMNEYFAAIDWFWRAS